jgi:hypothetical protein
MQDERAVQIVIMQRSIKLSQQRGMVDPQSDPPRRTSASPCARAEGPTMTLKNALLAALAVVAFAGAAVVAIAPSDPNTSVLVAFQVRR